ncbi:MAG: transcriptional regulator NrdR [Anaerofustis sp.]
MKCSKCGCIESKVIDSRPADEYATIRRRRECLECHYRFTTYERVESLPMVVVKKDGTRETFDRNKIIKGIMKACEKRPVSMDQIETMASNIESELSATSSSEIASSDIGEAIMLQLKNIDDVAYVRFASVYRRFKDINTFMEELNLLLKEQHHDEQH